MLTQKDLQALSGRVPRCAVCWTGSQNGRRRLTRSYISVQDASLCDKNGRLIGAMFGFGLRRFHEVAVEFLGSTGLGMMRLYGHASCLIRRKYGVARPPGFSGRHGVPQDLRMRWVCIGSIVLGLPNAALAARTDDSYYLLRRKWIQKRCKV